MTGFIKKIKAVWPYIVFAFAMIVVFIFVLFPDRLLSSLISEKFGSVLPGYAFQAEKADFTFPPGLKFFKPSLTIKTGETLDADYLYIRPSFFSIIGLSKSFSADIRAFGGKGDLAANLKDLRTLEKADVNLKSLDLSKLPKSLFKGYEVKGVLDTDLSMEQGEKGYDGLLYAKVSKAGIELPIISGIDLSDASADIECSIKANTADIKRCVFSAGSFQGEAKGKVMLAFPLSRSSISLTVNVNRKEGGKDSGTMMDSFFKPGTSKKITLTGTIENPRYSLN